MSMDPSACFGMLSVSVCVSDVYTRFYEFHNLTQIDHRILVYYALVSCYHTRLVTWPLFMPSWSEG